MNENTLFIHDPKRIDPRWRECYRGDGLVRRLYGTLSEIEWLEQLREIPVPNVARCRCAPIPGKEPHR